MVDIMGKKKGEEEKSVPFLTIPRTPLGGEYRVYRRGSGLSESPVHDLITLALPEPIYYLQCESYHQVMMESRLSLSIPLCYSFVPRFVRSIVALANRQVRLLSALPRI